MKETGLLFTGPMVRAILEGRKTQTRRIVRLDNHGLIDKAEVDIINLWYFFTSDNYVVTAMKCPYGGVGDRIWVRETFCLESNINIDHHYPPPFDDGRPIKHEIDPIDGSYWLQPHYRASDPIPELVIEGKDDPGVKWTSSIYMPRWASRITLEITDIQAQRVRDISEDDAKAEGAEKIDGAYRHGFKALWDSINAKSGYEWARNPWVWAITFKPIKEGPDDATR